MQTGPAEAPKRHHYVPVFLMRPWVDEADGMLLRYYRNRLGAVVSKRRSPRSVCFEEGLYSTPDLEPEHRQQMETGFMGRIDDAAANAHALLLAGGVPALDDRHRIDWALFIMSLWFRTPHDVKALADALAVLGEPSVSRQVLDVDAPEEWPAGAFRDLQMEALRELIEDRERWIALLEMEWAVVPIEPGRELWISDWALGLPRADEAPWLGAPGSYVALPISPSMLFVAAGSRAKLRAIESRSPREIISWQNGMSVGCAINFVGATGPRNADYIVRNFGQRTRPSLLGSLAGKYRAMGSG